MFKLWNLFPHGRATCIYCMGGWVGPIGVPPSQSDSYIISEVNGG